jgi:hypothetical protein
VGSLQDVGNAIEWFHEMGVEIQRSGRDMPGSNWHTYLYDPDGYCLQLYYYMEQVGWDGRPRPKEQQRLQVKGEWPEALEPLSDTYQGEPYMGPWW